MLHVCVVWVVNYNVSYCGMAMRDTAMGFSVGIQWDSVRITAYAWDTMWDTMCNTVIQCGIPISCLSVIYLPAACS